ncbi:CRISPR-associated endonuclease Cas3'' [Myceligenerans pegani]|uniref:CRISPR-associated endonuclease Cas3 n=1 Tax=Myceligenerans pegani TaxID=2776917 RepID=A0ABR9N1C7_9MICO|nr:CRISPR-associated endonuclease Cas3'' [Myceligenerans sp. TRM 65318]MBE1877456.1 CRISPR-associated endonuclease Cas3'' [Myceligenerans sp. TRM 65318]MBE3019727.1 CRISPR-associated endonuclease Cas3'' [Myceligenerans sp. TRM 65318]
MPRGAASSLWGKTSVDADGVLTWLPLIQHMEDSAAVAGRLWDRWLPAQLKRVLIDALPADDVGEGFPDGEAAARALLVFVAGAHDVGKATPAFQVKVSGADHSHGELARRVRESIGLAVEIPNYSELPHGRAGQVIVQRWLRESFGWDDVAYRAVGSVIGAHYGVPSSTREVDVAARRRELLGEDAWRETQDSLLNDLIARHGLTPHLESWASLRLTGTALMTLSGLVIAADWIASSTWLFPQAPIEDDVVRFDDRARLEAAWRKLRFPAPWSALDQGSDATTMLRERFELPQRAVARPLQAAALECARSMDLPGLLILEAPTGDGKTEAALLAAEILAARTGASGVFVALPTQATSDAMFARFLKWLARVPSTVSAADPDAPLVAQEAEQRAVYLAHGKSRLDPVFRMLRAGKADREEYAVASGIDDADDVAARRPHDSHALRGEAYVNWWFSDPKRGVLADFVVGTIDQGLFTSLQARHVVLRHLAMARKVVVLDEIHSYDAYMNRYLSSALEWFGAYGIPVVALSATLPSGLREELVQAYRKGRESRTSTPVPQRDTPPRAVQPRRRRRTESLTAASPTSAPAPAKQAVVRDVAVADEPTSFIGYDKAGVRHRLGVGSSGRSVTIDLERIGDGPEELVATVAEALGLERQADGTWRGEPTGCALVLRNTVRRAREAARLLARVLDPQHPDADPRRLVRLHHSQFITMDRQINDDELRRELGPPGEPTEVDDGRRERPRARVVVATQVAEQSLDIDVDFLVTDLAPIDLLLQRMGRLHRHSRPVSHRPARLARPRCVITGVDWNRDIGMPKPTQATKIYDAAAQLRSIAVLDEVFEGTGVVWIPQDLGPFVERAYGGQIPGRGEWRDVIAKADATSQRERQKQEGRARSYLLASPRQVTTLDGLLEHHAGEAERDGRARVRDTQDSIEVLLVEAQDGRYRIPSSNPSPLDGQWVVPDFADEPEIALALARCSVRVPLHVTQEDNGEALLNALEKHYHHPWQSVPELKGQLVLPLETGRDGRPIPVAGHVFTYNSRDGLEARKENKDKR